VYKTRMLQGLEDIRRNLKDFLFHKGRRNVKVVDPNLDIRGLSNAEIWSSDPVHPKEEVYKKIAEGLINVVATATESSKRTRSNSWGTGSEDRGRGRAPDSTRFYEAGRGGGRGWERGRPPSYGRGRASEYRRGNASFNNRGRGHSLGKRY
jgi:hypothetical protein